jgi:hypothetical protein
MKKLLSSSIIAAAALVLAVGANAAVEIGKPAPNFTLTDTHGKAHALADYAGKVVVLEWINLGCPYVQKHYDSQHMQNLQKTYTGKEVVWLTICSSAPGTQGNLSPAEWNKEIAAKSISSSAVLIDEPGKVGRLYGAKTTPHMFVVDPAGALVYDGGIDNMATTNVADLAKATNYVAAALDSVLAGKPVATATSKPYGCSVKYASPDS